MNTPKWWQRLLPRYGNWGGPGWSGGAWLDDPNLTDWSVRPIDAMDKAFRDHDMMYQTCLYSRVDADRLLLRQLVFNCPVHGWYAHGFKIACIIIFAIRSLR